MSGIIKERLKSVKSLVPKGTRLLDVGSDHAALPLALISEGKIEYAVISDINAKPLERAETEMKKAGLAERCTFVLSDGFEKIDENSFDTASICGMGGALITEILKKGRKSGNLADRHILIIQPMTDCETVRRYLWDNGYLITDELFSVEEGKKQKSRPYVVLKAVYDGKTGEYSFGDLFLGKIRPKNDAFSAFRSKTMRSLVKKQNGILISLKPSKKTRRVVYFIKDTARLFKTDGLFVRYMKNKLLK